MSHSHSSHPSSEVLAQIKSAVLAAIPDAIVQVSGGGGHYELDVVSTAFAGKTPLQSQRLVYSAIKHLMAGDSAPVHAVDSLRTRLPS
jgi:acid stress-induced BolA-like protein IbaG/YrbA